MTKFDDISQEKFDKLGEKIETGIRKNLKINYVDIQDFKNIDSISTELGDWNIIGGYNANGKSSFTEAILTAIQGGKFYGKGAVPPASLVRSGENKAVIKLLIKGEEEEIIIERTFKRKGNPTLEATLNGKKIAQATLDELLNSLTIDPLKLSNLSITDQIKEIKATIGLDTDEIDKEIKNQEDLTKETRAFKKQAQSVYDDFISSGVPEKIEEQSMSELLEKRKLFEKKAQKLSEYKNKKDVIEDFEEQIKILQQKLEQEKERLEIIKTDGKAINLEIEEAGLTDVETLDNQINAIEENNQKAKKYKDYLSKKEYLLNTSKDFEKDEEKLSKLRSQRTEMIANSNIPKYMSIDEELGILVDGLEFKLLNTAKKIEVAIDLVLISGSPLRMIRIENGGELDSRTLERIKPKILENGFQIFLERPILDKFDTIIINDGEIIDDKETFINNQ